ncbi:BPSS1780 family membrane protein [Duganella sp. P38]|uniref:BPSS1780 family membrane protein n=1 Tax=Duganella sp. P38 TaxID=3423949 RepID=UPI003D7B44CB
MGQTRPGSVPQAAGGADGAVLQLHVPDADRRHDPAAGAALPSLLAPLFSVALLQACADVDHGKRAFPLLVTTGFKKPVRRPLLQLGGLYLVVALLALTALRLLGDDVFSQIDTTEAVRIDKETLEKLQFPILISALISLSGWLLGCPAAPLIHWQKMTLAKALFFSVVTVGRNFKAFITATVTLYLLCQLVVLVVSLLAAFIPLLALTLMFSTVLLMIVLVHCTLYVAYRQLFGTPPASPEAVDLAKR